MENLIDESRPDGSLQARGQNRAMGGVFIESPARIAEQSIADPDELRQCVRNQTPGDLAADLTQLRSASALPTPAS